MQATKTFEDMLIEGFEWRQVVRLTDLQAEYPYREYTENNREFGRLELMRWLYRSGRFGDDGEK